MSGLTDTTPSQSTIYRPEAIEGLRSRYGKPAPLFGLSMWTFVLLAFGIVAAVVTFLSVSSFSRKETVSGTLETDAGSAEISFDRPGVVEAVLAEEGQIVKKGQPLFRISLETTLDGGRTLGSRLMEANDAEVAEVEHQLRSVRESNAAQRAESLDRLANSRSQVAMLGETLGLQLKRLELDRQTVTSLETLAGKGFVSQVRLRDQQAQELATRQAINETQRQIGQSRSEVLAAEAALARIRSDGAQSLAQLRANKATLAEKRAQSDAARSVVLVAPQDGRIVTVGTSKGETLTAGETLATVLPAKARLEAEVWVPSRAAGFVREGDEARIMFDGFPYERFGMGKGQVVSISSTPVDPKDLPIAGDSKEALFRVRVSLAAQSVRAYGRDWPLSPGSRLRADLILEHQSLLDWVLDPLRAVKGHSA